MRLLSTGCLSDSPTEIKHNNCRGNIQSVTTSHRTAPHCHDITPAATCFNFAVLRIFLAWHGWQKCEGLQVIDDNTVMAELSRRLTRRAWGGSAAGLCKNIGYQAWTSLHTSSARICKQNNYRNKLTVQHCSGRPLLKVLTEQDADREGC